MIYSGFSGMTWYPAEALTIGSFGIDGIHRHIPQTEEVDRGRARLLIQPGGMLYVARLAGPPHIFRLRRSSYWATCLCFATGSWLATLSCCSLR